MKSKTKGALLLALLFCVLTVSVSVANAYCPPGMHWSYRAESCVPNGPPGPPPPPPPAYDDYYHHHHHYGGCNRNYQRCLAICAGNPACVNNCNIGYTMCRQQHR